MDLIYTKASREDVGVLMGYAFDLAFGADENDFECKIQSSLHCCEAGSYLYIEGTEYGGIVDEIGTDTSTNEVTYYGRTWHGILNSKVLEPDSGEDYLKVSGEANTVLGELIDRMGLSALFQADPNDSELDIKSYKMNRYIKGYDGIRKMLDTVNAKLLLSYQGKKVVLSAVPKHDYSKDEEFDSDQLEFEVTKKFNTVNHLICLGSGELANRTVIHLYADKEGNISQTQSQFGLDEYTDVYDYSNAESEEELLKSGMDELNALWEPGELSVDMDDSTDNYDVGDIVGAFDNITGIAVAEEITKKIVTIENGRITISYEVGD